jgi:hypothetical protein
MQDSNYDEFGNYIGPDVDAEDNDEEVAVDAKGPAMEDEVRGASERLGMGREGDC